MLERFAEQARTVVADTMATAQVQGIPEVHAEHLLLSLVRIADGATSTALAENHLDEELVARVVRGPEQLVDDEDRAALGALGIDVDDLMARLEEGLGPDALASLPSGGVRRPRFTKEAKKALEMAVRTTTSRHARTITTDDLLVGIVRAGSCHGGFGARLRDPSPRRGVGGGIRRARCRPALRRRPTRRPSRPNR